MGISGATPGDRARPWLLAAHVAIGWGLFTVFILHVVSGRNPVWDTLSSYALSDGGVGLLGAGMIAIAAGSAALLGALRAAGHRLGPATHILFWAWSSGLVAAALFPASYPERFNPVSGQIHEYACTVAFLSLAALGWTLPERLRTHPAIVRLTLLSLGGVLLFGVSYLMPGVLPVGLSQRLALAADIGLLVTIARAVTVVVPANPRTRVSGGKPGALSR
ncbi:DUF998 domain-containing protein [Amycolatopsis thermophila]|uniref:DUF998 domain-containing protein n=1 Tax=Amycolatopsis thermophila TaxID=206084 RepID=A0ABU0ER64_9PSEU|nr:DUF998 domain-containing protein [Amycolatopsis thermophila]MDQ0377793.1 hypothetical protein [Amycolatopsis thermophila]